MMETGTTVRVDARHPETRPHKRLVTGDPVSKGGMASILEAVDTNLLRTCAVKVIDPELARDKAMLRQFIEEAQITAQLDHPYIVPVHELAVDRDGALYFTMKRVRGVTLADVLASQSLASRTDRELQVVLEVLLKVCDALSFAHSRGVIHQDLKPENVMVGDHGQVYLMDWGIARLKDGARAAASAPDTPRGRGKRYKKSPKGVILGTPFYMAPERADRSGTVDERSDVFSLGGILYEVLTLAPPYLGQDTGELLDQVRAGRVVPPGERVGVPLPPGLGAIAMKAMRPRPGERHQSVIELRAELQEFLQSGWQYPRRAVPPGKMIVREGVPGDEAYIIVEGRCRVVKEIDGRRVVLREMGPGDVFGETAVLTAKPRAATVEAIDRVVLAVVGRAEFGRDQGGRFWMGRFTQVLAERFRDVDARAADLESKLMRSQLVEQVLMHLIHHGPEAGWSQLRKHLVAQTGRTSEELTRSIRDSGRFTIDEPRDTIRLAT